MRPLPHMMGLALAAMPPSSLFLAQTWLVATERSEAVLALAKYSGLLGLIFFAFDGSSGLIPAMLRLRHGDAALRFAYRFYRAGIAVLLLVTLPIPWILAPADTATLLPFLAIALLLRLPLMDADLDRRGFPHWAMLLQNGWMLPLGLAGILNDDVTALMAGHAALWSTLVLVAAHVLLARHDRVAARTGFRPALVEIITIMGGQGIGQLYGRTVLLVIGASFAGPLAALIVYAKQAFNAAGLLLIYLRRVELARHRTSMGLSLTGQAAVALVAGLLVALAAARLGISHGLVLTLIGWQSLEKLSSTATYAFQLNGRHRLALVSLASVCTLGLAGLTAALAQASPLLLVALETLGYGLVLSLWFWSIHGSQDSRASGRP